MESGGHPPEDRLLALLQRLAEEQTTAPSDTEEATKQGVILPILFHLGWDRDNVHEVVPEYRVENGRVDYCLRLGEKNAAFVEAKRPDQDLERHQEQLLGYAFREGVELAVLTNGVVWWLYLPLLEGSWGQRKFFTIDLSQQDPLEAAASFRSFLGKPSIADESAVRHAKELHASRAKEQRTQKTLPKAWWQLLEEPDEILADLLSERVESMCGHRPTPDQVAEFLGQSTDRWVEPNPVATPERPRVPPVVVSRRTTGYGGYKGKTPQSFTLLGHHQQATTFKEVLLGVCTEMARRHGPGFERVTTLRGRKRAWFSRHPHGMTNPVQVPETNIIYVEANLSADNIVKRCGDVLKFFGHDPRDLQVTAS